MVWWIKPVNVIVIEWTFAGLATCFVLLRLYIRNRYNRGRPRIGNSRFKLFNHGDWIILITLLCFYATASCDTAMVTEGFGGRRLNLHHNRNDPDTAYRRLEKGRLQLLLKLLFFSTLPYYFSLWGVKIYLLTLYYKIVIPSLLPTQRLLLHVLSALVGATCVVWIFLNMFWCVPTSKNWEVSETHRACLAYFARVPYITSVSMHVGTELLIFSFPFTFLHYLHQLDRRRYYAAAGMFAIGFVGVIISLGRVAYIFTQGSPPIISMAQAWSSLEQGVGIIICCLPAFKTLLEARISKSNSSNGSEGARTELGQPMKQPERNDHAGSSTQSDYGSEVRPWENEMRGSWTGRGTVIDPDNTILRVDSFERAQP
ncbi:hypothetical protein TWF696_001663 [Orbilia brochopaga]|uniref:Rhodopsin domain-containing protein n=1 Tax=Orbilia brochopaga TaxID=3140254 RepID=A0AAV9U5Z2_9PEZI